MAVYKDFTKLGEKPNKNKNLQSFLGFSEVFRKVLQEQVRT